MGILWAGIKGVLTGLLGLVVLAFNLTFRILRIAFFASLWLGGFALLAVLTLSLSARLLGGAIGLAQNPAWQAHLAGRIEAFEQRRTEKALQMPLPELESSEAL